jgi:diguanylate cyclase (GGDEF)-like protein/PAS domain S-box-containing protein
MNDMALVAGLGHANGKELRILLVEDSPSDAELCQRELRRAGLKFTVRCVETLPAFERELEDFKPDLVLSDFSMPTSFDGLMALDLTRAKSAETPFVFVSGTIGEDRAVDAMRRGATDYVLKDRMHRLIPVIQRALQEAQERTARRRAQEALEESEARFRSFMQHLPGRASIRDREGRCTYVNESWERAFGKSASDVIGRTVEESWPADQAAELKSVDVEVAATGKPARRAFRTGEGDAARWWQSHYFPIPDATGRPAFIGTVGFDITEQKLQEEKIARLTRIYAVLSGINSAIVRIRDRRELLHEACRIAVEHGGFAMAWIGEHDPETQEITPLASAGLEGASLLTAKLNLRDDSPRSQGLIAQMVKERCPVYSNDITREGESGGEWRAEAILRGYRSLIALPLVVESDIVGNLSLFSHEAGFFNDEELKLLTELAGDISFALEYIRKEEKLNYLAYYDALTGLPNRSLFNVWLQQRVNAVRSEHETVSVIMLDIEHFRRINETLGRQAGDDLLRQIAQRLKGALLETDILAHVGGDNFGIATRGVDEAGDFAHILEQILSDVCGQPFKLGNETLRIAARAGVAVYPADGADADSLLKNAEAALKDAKKRGHGYQFYAPEMNARVAEQLKLENDLRRGVLEEQFVLYYQPRIDLASGRIAGLEALIRWAHPERGLVPPGEFIPTLETTGLILDAGRWVLKRAAQDHAAWCAKGIKPPRIAVNVSAIELRSKAFVEHVRTALSEAGESGKQIDIEITESMLMEDIDGNIEKLKAVQATGVQIAMDDFGTGYSSLSYLATLPINSLKIDRSFVYRMPKGPEQMAIVSTIISLARAFHLKVVAEGVETEEQSNLLRLLHCDEGQGYLYTRPLAPVDMEVMLRQQ